MTDVIIVGSGASAVHAARPLVEAGLSVLMLDVGHRDDTYAPLIPDRPFSEIRRTDPNQHRYFLGDRFEGVPVGSVRVGAQLTPPRAHIARPDPALAPLDAPAFACLETLARGGLAAGWGAGVTRFNADDLARTPLTPADLEPHYRAVEEHIGVCAEPDDLSPGLGDHHAAMPPLRLDTGAAALLDRYHRRRARLHQLGLRLGRARLAACSREHRGRGPHPYHDLDFWADHRRAVYRPQWTLDELQTRENFTYLPGRLVFTFDEGPRAVRVTCRRADDGTEETHAASALILAAGVMGTARIVLRSLRLYDYPLPLIANPYTYAPCLNLNMLGREPDDRRHSLAQLLATFALPGSADPPAYIAVYSYRSLLTFKLMKEAPLGARASLRLLAALMPMITILGLQHADYPTPAKHIVLRRAAGPEPERLAVRYALSPEETARIDRTERAILLAFRALGCFAIRRINPGHGSSIHYAGTLPMRARPGPLECDADGRLHATARTHIADGSLLPDLPAKGLTLTLMANAHRIGSRLAERLR